jgi:heme/copper-type cytochrome/quinol oxidase subunit 3
MSEHAHALMPAEWPRDGYVGRATSGKVGMWVFLLSDALMFAGFLLSYGILRGASHGYAITETLLGKVGDRVDYWQCTPQVAAAVGCIPEPGLGVGFTAVLTFILICSSVSMVMAYGACVERDHRGMERWFVATIVGGILFLCGQYQEYFGITSLLGHGLTNEGLNFGQSAYASTFFIVTSFHGAHVFSGVTYLSVIFTRVKLGKYDDGNYNHIEIVGLFWHFVDLIWILVFTLIYLIPPEPLSVIYSINHLIPF